MAGVTTTFLTSTGRRLWVGPAADGPSRRSPDTAANLCPPFGSPYSVRVPVRRLGKRRAKCVVEGDRPVRAALAAHLRMTWGYHPGRPLDAAPASWVSRLWACGPPHAAIPTLTQRGSAVTRRTMGHAAHHGPVRGRLRCRPRSLLVCSSGARETSTTWPL